VYIIFQDGIAIFEERVEAMRSWECPKTQKDIGAFMGFANYYRRFMEIFSKIGKPLTDLTKEEFKERNFQRSTWAKVAFNQLKISLKPAPILWHFDLKLPLLVDTDGNDYAIIAILLQVEDSHLKPVPNHSRTIDKVEINYEIHDKRDARHHLFIQRVAPLLGRCPLYNYCILGPQEPGGLCYHTGSK
jgi:hypothetical protein